MLIGGPDFRTFTGHRLFNLNFKDSMANPFLRKTEKILSAAPLQIPAGVLSETIPLASVIFPDLDISQYPVSVSEAMSTPAVNRAISIYSTITSRFVLDSDNGSTPWLNQSSGPITPQMRIAYTVQDLIFRNQSLWMVERDSDGAIYYAEHIAANRWTNDAVVGVKVDDRKVDQKNLIWFGGLLPGGGFLEHGRHSVRQYLSIAQTINNRAKTASPVTLVKETQDSGATLEEITESMDNLTDSLQSRGGGMVFVPFGIEIQGYGAGDNSNEMMVAARNAVRLDIANHLNINASLLEGTADGSSDSYSNTLMVQNELLELSIKGFCQPIADRLSSDDVTAPGVKVTFDYSTFDTRANDKSDLGTLPTQDENNV